MIRRPGAAERDAATQGQSVYRIGPLKLLDGGLEHLIGLPSKHAAPMEVMRSEHLESADAKLQFSSRRGFVTTSEMEWVLVVDGCDPPEGNPTLNPSYSGIVREARPLTTFKESMQERNEELKKAGYGAATMLVFEEMLGARLYTGSMYAKYQVVLRIAAFPGDENQQKQAQELGFAGGYTTTIYAVNSAVVKLSKLMPIGTVYRSVAKTSIPPSFFEPNESQLCGGVEVAFTSFTPDRDTSVEYLKPAGFMITLTMSMASRGADMQWVTQYPHEREVLWPALTGLELLDWHVDKDAGPISGEGPTGPNILHISCGLAPARQLTLQEAIEKPARFLDLERHGVAFEIEDGPPLHVPRNAANLQDPRDEPAISVTRNLCLRQQPSLRLDPEWQVSKTAAVLAADQLLPTGRRRVALKFMCVPEQVEAELRGRGDLSAEFVIAVLHLLLDERTAAGTPRGIEPISSILGAALSAACQLFLRQQPSLRLRFDP